MKKEKRNSLLYIQDILQSMLLIEEYVQGYDYLKFVTDRKTVDAVIRNFEIIGEAAKNIPSELKEKYPDVPWEEMYRLRNRISHEYFGIDYENIWDIAVNYLPKNFIQVNEILLIELK